MEALNGKVVVVSGGAKRLGRAMVIAMAAAGARVAFTWLNSEKEARQTEREANGSQAFQCDIRDARSVAATVDSIVGQFGNIDILVNNAGIYQTVPFDDLTVEQWDDMFAVNVRGAFLMSKQCAPALRAAKGRIVNLGSLGGQKPWTTHIHYCSSKAALHMLTRATAKALAPDVAVNCVAPGMIDQEEPERAPLARFAASTPMGRNGLPDDIVSAVLYFATAPHFVTGQILTVDGGLGLR
ncbi:MAG TPA: SDR family oxidoreductase [Candidatus Angelobacter sp.]|nr:SDR family oxidoreductase [Candidatus Angelobacter sp.]